MPAQIPTAKFIAKFTGWQSKDTDQPGELTLFMEWKKLDGDREGGKFEFQSDPIQGETELKNE
jgi:hypothetical protein